MRKSVLSTLIAGAALGGAALLAAGPTAVFADEGAGAAPSPSKSWSRPDGQEQSGQQQKQQKSGEERAQGGEEARGGQNGGEEARGGQNGGEEARGGQNGGEKARGGQNGGEKSWTGEESDRERGETLLLEVRTDKATFVDVGRKGPGVGDELVLSGRVLEQGRTVGEADAVCTATHKGRESLRAQCVATLTLREGQITVQGVVPVTEDGAPLFYDLAVTGGTGKFKAARGYTANTTINDRVILADVHLVK